MHNKFSISLITSILTLLLLTACGGDGSDDSATEVAKSEPDQTRTKPGSAAKPASKNEIPTDGVMAEPVNFSTPEDIEKSFQAIKDEAGEQAESLVKNAIGYMMVYDLSVNRNEQKLYRKLDGKTPNQILAMAN